MPDTSNGRKLIREYLENNSISVNSLAKAYGYSRAYMSGVLSGKKDGQAANGLILKLVEDLPLHQKEKGEDQKCLNSK